MTPVPNRPFRVTALTAAVVASVALIALPVRAAVDPPTVQATLAPGESHHVDKTVDVPDFPPKLDVCLIVDLSASYNDDLGNIKGAAPGIFDTVQVGVTGGDVRFGLATFVDYPFSVWGVEAAGDYAYRLDQALTPTKATWVAAVNAMGTRNGGDGPESQYEAVFQATTGAGRDVGAAGPSLGDIAAGQQCGFTVGRSAVIILTTDAPFHNAGDGGGPFPYPGPSQATVIATLNGALGGAGIVFVGLKAPGATTQMDSLAAATGGTTVATTATSSDIATAILTGLSQIVVTVEHEVSETGGTPADSCDVVTLDPDFIDIDPPEAGTTVEFEEWIDIPADITGAELTADGMIHCDVDFTGNGAPLGQQTVWITVKRDVDIDIKPNSDPNSINLKRQTGVIPVAILGSDTFDVADIDVTTLTFGAVGTEQIPAHDLTARDHTQDVNSDGFDDLVSHYVIGGTGIMSGDTEACISGQTNDGINFMGCDAVRTLH